MIKDIIIQFPGYYKLQNTANRTTCSRCRDEHWQSEQACPRCGKTRTWIDKHIPTAVYPLAALAVLMLYRLVFV